MRVRFALDLGAGTFRRGEVRDLPDETARAMVAVGYADALPLPAVGGPGVPDATDILTDGPGEVDSGPPAGN